MKRVLIICGTGVATSTVVAGKVRERLEQEGIEAVVTQGKVMDLLQGVDTDLIVATTQVPDSVEVPVIQALPLLTGMGEEETLDQVVSALQ